MRSSGAVNRHPQLRIRTASLTDIEQMHGIRLRVRENALTDPNSVRPEHYVTMLNERGGGWVAEVDGQIVGFAIADRIVAHVWALFVDPPFEGQGIGRQLHDTMIGSLFGTGAAVVRLGTTPRTRAAKFYEAAGWRLVGHHEDGEARYELTKQDWKGGPPLPGATPASRARSRH